MPHRHHHVYTRVRAPSPAPHRPPKRDERDHEQVKASVAPQQNRSGRRQRTEPIRALQASLRRPSGRPSISRSRERFQVAPARRSASARPDDRLQYAFASRATGARTRVSTTSAITTRSRGIRVSKAAAIADAVGRRDRSGMPPQVPRTCRRASRETTAASACTSRRATVRVAHRWTRCQRRQRCGTEAGRLVLRRIWLRLAASLNSGLRHRTPPTEKRRLRARRVVDPTNPRARSRHITQPHPRRRRRRRPQVPVGVLSNPRRYLLPSGRAARWACRGSRERHHHQDRDTMACLEAARYTGRTRSHSL